LDVRQSAGYAIGDIKDESVVPELVEIFMNKDENLGVRVSAISAVGKIGDKEAVPELIQILKNREEDKEMRRLSAEAIKNIGFWSVPKEERVEVEVMALLAIKDRDRIVIDIKESAVPYLIEVLSTKESADMQKVAGEALIEIAEIIAYRTLNGKEDFIQALEKIEKWNDLLRESENLSEEVRRVINKLKRVINKLRNEVDRSTGEILDEKNFGGGGTTDNKTPGRFGRLRI